MCAHGLTGNRKSTKRALIVGGCLIVSHIVGCAHSVDLTSKPSEANVYFLDEKGKRVSPAGKTPVLLQKPPDAVREYYLELEKPGYVSQILAIGQPHRFGSSTSVEVVLAEEDQSIFNNAMVSTFSAKANELINNFLILQSATAQGDASKVQALEKKMKRSMSSFSSFNLLMGRFYLQKKDYAKAKKYLKTASQQNPLDPEISRLMKLTSPNKKK